MRFKPLSEQEIQEAGLLPEGIYNFEVIEANDRVSKSGNEMIAIKLNVLTGHNVGRSVFDYLLESMAFKLKHFTEVAKLDNKYNDGTLTAQDCLGKRGQVHIVISPAKDGYDAKNSVKDYVVDSASQSAPSKKMTDNPFTPPKMTGINKSTGGLPQEAEAFGDDDLPF